MAFLVDGVLRLECFAVLLALDLVVLGAVEEWVEELLEEVFLGDCALAGMLSSSPRQLTIAIFCVRPIPKTDTSTLIASNRGRGG